MMTINGDMAIEGTHLRLFLFFQQYLAFTLKVSLIVCGNVILNYIVNCAY